ncbi:MAG TPA: SDR family NAD(P)-dependent oxidoreductase, partial [Marmoricola sp.]
MRGLAGRGVLISGGTSGIGLGAAQRFLEEGCRVLVTGHAEADVDRALDTLAEHAGLAGGRVLDVRDTAAIGEVVAAADEACGGLTVLANNAGIARRK